MTERKVAVDGACDAEGRSHVSEAVHNRGDMLEVGHCSRK